MRNTKLSCVISHNVEKKNTIRKEKGIKQQQQQKDDQKMGKK